MNYTIYVKKTCPYSQQAMKALKKHKHTYTAIDVLEYGGIATVVENLKQKKCLPNSCQHNTVPIVFAPDGKFIGGCEDLIKHLS